MVEPLAMPEGTCVHLSVEEEMDSAAPRRAAKMQTPKLAHPKDAADFVMEIREIGNTGNAAAGVP